MTAAHQRDYEHLKRQLLVQWGRLGADAVKWIRDGLREFVCWRVADDTGAAAMLAHLERAGMLSPHSVSILGHVSEAVGCADSARMVAEFERTHRLRREDADIDPWAGRGARRTAAAAAPPHTKTTSAGSSGGPTPAETSAAGGFPPAPACAARKDSRTTSVADPSSAEQWSGAGSRWPEGRGAGSSGLCLIRDTTESNPSEWPRTEPNPPEWSRTEPNPPEWSRTETSPREWPRAETSPPEWPRTEASPPEWPRIEMNSPQWPTAETSPKRWYESERPLDSPRTELSRRQSEALWGRGSEAFSAPQARVGPSPPIAVCECHHPTRLRPLPPPTPLGARVSVERALDWRPPGREADDAARRERLVDFLAGRLGGRYLQLGAALELVSARELEALRRDTSRDLVTSARCMLELYLSRRGTADVERELSARIRAAGCHRLADQLDSWIRQQDQQPPASAAPPEPSWPPRLTCC